MSSGPIIECAFDIISTKVEITNELWPQKRICNCFKSTKVEITNELWPITADLVIIVSTKVEITNELWPWHSLMDNYRHLQK